MHLKLLHFRLFLVLLVLSVCHSTSLPSEAQKISFGVVPQQSATKLAKKWVPLLYYLSIRSGYEIEFKTAPDIPEFEKRLNKGMYDLAYMNPYHYTVFSKQPGYKAFAKEKGKKISGIIVVRKGSVFTNTSELDGEEVSFPSPAAFAASILTQAHLNQKGVKVNPNYVKSHDSVYRTVSKGIFSAGGGIVRTFNNISPSIKTNLRILWVSESYTPHAFAAHPELSSKVLSSITNKLVSMLYDNEADVLLRNLNMNGFEQAKDSDWDDIRSLRINDLFENTLEK